MNKKAVLFLIHIPVWILVLSFVFVIGYKSIHAVDIPFLISSSIIIAFWLILSFYVFYSYLVPKYLEKGRYRLFATYATLFIVVVMPFLQLTLSAFNLRIFGEHTTLSFPTSGIIFPWLGGIAGALVCGGLGALYRFAIDWFKNLQLKKDLENKNLQSELKTIKSKLNPHLLFNTLNNIDTLIQTDPVQASTALSKLSDLLRYVVYDTEEDKVPIKKEIDNLNKYIDLEKIRLVNPDSVTFSTEISDKISIPPMIFFPFVENGFKHSNLNNENQKLRISISDNNGKIFFECVNTIIEKPQKTDNIGIGLDLAKKRLELLYPDKHELKIKLENNEFYVSLQIDLD